MSGHILEIDSVKKRFGEKIILSDVWLTCKTGEIVGLLGRNGSGKSTLLRIIFGMISADQKFLKIDNEPVVGYHRHISYLEQDNFIPAHLPVKTAIALSLEKSQVDRFCDDPMVGKIYDSKIGNLSSGERRYLEIRLLLFNPAKFVLLDEPYNGLSPQLVETVNALIIEKSQEKGIVITDHNYRNIIDVSSRLILMKDGKLHHLQNKSELVEKGYLREGMF
ncbi:MAG: ATP-binding cassette domain-containing protein [Flavobacterium sp.]|uniref:ATP-binding cassette domain-containing protein n=1 Tax=Flavobacterium sp. TaxID=239 RepID=UPI001219EA04|nr:ATP-binding cassette domain-containing protein [Flavobacterium sp.]RZJ68046.1 MAG: ATP-binding cassette domain-containing protein [Flavobacterium sp.]